MTLTETPVVSVDDEPARLAAVRRYNILDTPPDGAFDRVAALAARLFDVPIATVTIVDEDRIWFKAQQGLPEGIRQIGRDPGLCASAIMENCPYVVTDALHDPRTLDNPLVHGELGVRFYAAAPITTADGYRLGTINVLDVKPREIDPEAVEVLSELAGIVMDELELRLTAMTTVRAERERRLQAEQEQLRLETITATLQRTLLPPALPSVPGMESATLYHVASPDQLGGDFYDVFHLDDGRWAFFLGDVCGKGAPAAALTSLTRYTLRAAAIYDPDPVAVLHNLNTVLLQEYDADDPTYCTVLFGVITPVEDGFSVTLAGGGHPPALAVRASGAVELVHPAGGLLVGLFTTPSFESVTFHLGPGDGLLLYTDGLTEARLPGGHLFGEDRLAELAATLAGTNAQRLVSEIQNLLTGFGPGLADDTAILALTVPAAAPPTSSASSSSVLSPSLSSFASRTSSEVSQ
ncbi:SpoIIE family protein phosphatase [Planotetraspora sp. A-T 1434]|uniref:PP2C family protein-serine/threonine phosphatase n=1 Tax=Planotetraspora sp. A-T 1434 TaxID=2979219 RepID=UPI0021C0D4FE|nr:GAF domain-containing SpoIIE family protein phosphatase [Planotetraspora sp. A-T 1434]MCT9935242.1 SpoIIE family protein phosphatase [Planotetraspora sp. A-T 1434]